MLNQKVKLVDCSRSHPAMGTNLCKITTKIIMLMQVIGLNYGIKFYLSSFFFFKLR